MRTIQVSRLRKSTARSDVPPRQFASSTNRDASEVCYFALLQMQLLHHDGASLKPYRTLTEGGAPYWTRKGDSQIVGKHIHKTYVFKFTLYSACDGRSWRRRRLKSGPRNPCSEIPRPSLFAHFPQTARCELELSPRAHAGLRL